MRRRILCFLGTCLIVLGSIFSSIPLQAGAIVPIGFVQSALASYVSSTGYKLYNDNGTGQDILGSLGELYDDYVTISNKTITGQLANLAFLANSPYIYQDNSGQIVISKVAADIFQDFSDWIQSEYNVTVGSDTPTEVVSASGGSWSDGSGINCFKLSCSTPIAFTSPDTTYYADLNIPIGENYTGIGVYNSPVYFCSPSPNTAYLTVYDGYLYICFENYQFAWFTQFYDVDNYYLSAGQVYASSLGDWYKSIPADKRSNLIPVSTTSPIGTDIDDLTASGGVAALGVTLAQAVTDVIGQANEDDAVVIGVGASVGATAQDIADMVAQGVKAQTLDPSVSITAESVIDTPVQPYPDIDGLGLPELGAALVSRFPFCIPWDFVDTVKLLNADPVAPDIAVDLFPAAFKSKVGVTGSTEFRINLGDEKYQKIGTFCRWGSLIGFCFGLAMLTKRMIWTA